ncbi:hypothetical protein HBB16_07610 [Pseudonocardia sp. MCCB 268]|nr:hypothetical protein [Pseudonocardia cytotoxica]
MLPHIGSGHRGDPCGDGHSRGRQRPPGADRRASAATPFPATHRRTGGKR